MESYVGNWVSFFIALFLTVIDWLGSMEILGVSVAWIMVAFFLMGVLIRSLLFKP